MGLAMFMLKRSWSKAWSFGFSVTVAKCRGKNLIVFKIIFLFKNILKYFLFFKIYFNTVTSLHEKTLIFF